MLHHPQKQTTSRHDDIGAILVESKEFDPFVQGTRTDLFVKLFEGFVGAGLTFLGFEQIKNLVDIPPASIKMGRCMFKDLLFDKFLEVFPILFTVGPIQDSNCPELKTTARYQRRSVQKRNFG